MSDEFPVGTIAGPNRTVSPFFGRPHEIWPGWVLAMGQTISAEHHDNPKKRGQDWTLPDLRRDFTLGASTQLQTLTDEKGDVVGTTPAVQDMPGIYAVVKVRER